MLNLYELFQIGVYILFVVRADTKNQVKYTPDWASLDTRPIPEWYDKAKIGM